MKFERVYSMDLACRCFLTRVPEPPADALMPKEGEKGVYLGKTDILKNNFFWIPERLVNRNLLILGTSGAGKSTVIKTLLIRAGMEYGLNAVIVDFAGEYPGFVKRGGGHVLALGRKDFINILDLGGTNPGNRTEQVVNAFSISFDLSGAPRQRILLRKAVREAYRKAGITEDPSTWKKPAPTMKDVLKVLDKELEEAEAEGRIALRESLSSLMEKIEAYTTPPNDVLAKKSTISLEEFTRSGLVCVDLSGLPDENSRAAVALSVLDFLIEGMRREGWTTDKGIRTMVVLDEAFKVAKFEESPVLTLAKEGRKYGFSLLVATQDVGDVSDKVVSNSGTVVLMRMQDMEQIKRISGGLSLSQRLEELIPRLDVGQAVVKLGFSEGWEGAFTVKIDAETPRESADMRVPSPLGMLESRLRMLEVEASKLEKNSEEKG
jgi:energy-coupling factor transporter ATP-binding protein EcfA2